MKYFINTGIPCSIPHEYTGSKSEALADFRDYIAQCKRYGNHYRNAFLEFENGDLCEVGPRGGVKKLCN